MVAHHIVAPPHPENVITTPVSHGVHSYPRTPRCGATSMGFSVMNILPLRLPLWSYRTDALRLQQQCNFVSAPSCAHTWVQHHACPQPFQCDALPIISQLPLGIQMSMQCLKRACMCTCFCDVHVRLSATVKFFSMDAHVGVLVVRMMHTCVQKHEACSQM